MNLASSSYTSLKLKESVIPPQPTMKIVHAERLCGHTSWQGKVIRNHMTFQFWDPVL
jgi:hypothetical protein